MLAKPKRRQRTGDGLSRRTTFTCRFLGRSLMFAVSASLALTGCAVGPDPEGVKRDKAWRQVVGTTRAVHLGDNRLRVDTTSPFMQDIAISEFNVLARASGEAVRAGKSRFVIAYADYDDGPFGTLLLPEFDMPQTSWIGTYEALLEARSLSSMGSVGDNVGFRSMTVVVRLLDEGELETLPAFDAKGFYDAMLAERIERRNIRPDLYFPIRSYLPFTSSDVQRSND